MNIRFHVRDSWRQPAGREKEPRIIPILLSVHKMIPAMKAGRERPSRLG
jgi:hypothetical protein